MRNVPFPKESFLLLCCLIGDRDGDELGHPESSMSPIELPIKINYTITKIVLEIK
jgi:hypothetical protein